MRMPSRAFASAGGSTDCIWLVAAASLCNKWRNCSKFQSSPVFSSKSCVNRALRRSARVARPGTMTFRLPSPERPMVYCSAINPRCGCSGRRNPRFPILRRRTSRPGYCCRPQPRAPGAIPMLPATPWVRSPGRGGQIRTAGLKMREDNSRRFDSGPAWPRAIFRRRGMLRAARPRAPGRREV